MQVQLPFFSRPEKGLRDSHHANHQTLQVDLGTQDGEGKFLPLERDRVHLEQTDPPAKPQREQMNTLDI